MSHPTSTLPTCPHCAQPVEPDAAAAPFCCGGCRSAQALLKGLNLDRFYALRRGPGLPVGDGDAPTWAWLDAQVDVARARRCALSPAPTDSAAAPPAQLSLSLGVQGIHCAACVWVIQTLFRRAPGALRVDVNPGTGELSLVFIDGTFPLRAFLEDLARLGYRTGPPRTASTDGGADDLLMRVGLTAALAMNTMMLSLATYLGLASGDAAGLHRVFTWVAFGLSTLAVLIGGPVFFRAAFRGMRRRVLHLDLPIALGIGTAFVGNTWLMASGEADATYSDTLAVFIALMLLGRWLQRRLVVRSQRLLLADTGVDGLRVRRVGADGQLDVVPVATIEVGDTLLLAPGELLPVDATLAPETTRATAFSLAWINGEPEPVAYAAGALVPAGAHHASLSAVTLSACGPFSASVLQSLLTPAPAAGPARDPFWSRIAAGWVLGVLLAAAAGFGLWLSAGLPAALSVTVAVLVVTCPCALGLAVPLAEEIAHARLRRRGVFVRRDGALDRLSRVRTVLFDKTGTLTLGTLALQDPAALGRLNADGRDALYQMVSRSNHPKSRTLLAALSETAQPLPAFRADARVSEVAGVGLMLESPEARWSLHAHPDPAPAQGAETSRVELSRDGHPVATFAFGERLRHDASAAIKRLQRQGLDVRLLSGDAPARVASVARTLGLDPQRCHGGLSPADKARLVTALDQHDTLFVGDGINDGPALDAAFTAGTPAIDRPSVPARADFYLMGAGVGPVVELLTLARTLRRTVRNNLIIALVYNGVALSLALTGVLTPLLCAVLMPLSSLVVIGATVASLWERPATTAEPARAAATPTALVAPGAA